MIIYIIIRNLINWSINMYVIIFLLVDVYIATVFIIMYVFKLN